MEHETQNIINHSTKVVDISKYHNSEIQEKRHANKTEKQRKRKRNGKNVDVLKNLKRAQKPETQAEAE